jgi:polysaccharide export outer membrane protein
MGAQTGYLESMKAAAWPIAGVLLAMMLAGCTSASISQAGYSAAATGDELGEGGDSLQVVKSLPPPSSSAGAGQVIRTGDTLKVDFFGVDELDTTGQVDGHGVMALPLIGGVAAAGLVLEDFQADVTAKYRARYLQNPQITVGLEQTVTLDGEFSKAGAYPVAANTTLLRVVAAAGNFTGLGDPTNVFIYRTIDGNDYVAKYNVEDIRAGRRPDERVYGGDIVVAFPSGMKVVGRNLSDALGLARSAAGFL